MDMIIKHYQMIAITQDGPIVLTTSLSVKEDDLSSIQDRSLVLAILNSQFLLKLKSKYLAEQTYIPHVQRVLAMDNISELLEYEWGKPFGYIIQNITNPKHPITITYWSIETEDE